MVQIPGKYKLVENKNFYELLLAIGLPEDVAKDQNAIKGGIDISMDGDKLSLKNEDPDFVTNLVIGKEVEEPVRDRTLLSTTQMGGNVITISCKTTDGQPAGKRTLTFSDSGLELVTEAIRNGKTYTASRIYQRV